MHEKLEQLSDQLLSVSAALAAGTIEERPLNVVHTWLPALTIRQISTLSQNLAGRITQANIEILDPAEDAEVTALITSLDALKPVIIPHMFNGHAPTAGVHLVATMNYVANSVSNLLSWHVTPSSAMPAALAKKLHKTQRDLDNLLPDLAQVETRLATIKDAHDAAENLPATLQELRAARSELTSISTTAAELLGVIKSNDVTAKNLTEAIGESASEASTLVKQCADAHQFIVSTGLATSFATRAEELKTSMRWWVGALSGALIVGMLVGAWRLSEIGKVLNSNNEFDPNKLWVQVALSILSVGAPVWFAWMSTKQIGQRFRLAEDYAFKASVATAYEGYRRQAANIDPQLERALFSSALTRLDEQPLRLVETATHGSPIHELTNSPAVQNLTAKATELVEKVRGSRTKSPASPAE